jgi:8-oxo-dGTP diphosphatase
VSTGITTGAPVLAAGALIWRPSGDLFEVALVHRPRYRDWSWPKGKLEPGESAPVAAVREAAEETGTPVVLGVPLPSMKYQMPDGVAKHVRYWAARVATHDDGAALSGRPPVRRASLDEIDDTVWVPAGAAAHLLTRPTDRRPLNVLQELWHHGRLSTRVLVIARHGRARKRSAWDGNEATRPLTAQGRAQADSLVEVLAAFGVSEIVTSPWDRCLRTVAPYAERTGLPVHAMEALTEAAHAADPAAAVAACSDYLTRPRDAVVVTHRPVLPALMDVVGEATRRWTVGRLPTRDPYLRTGELLAVHVADSGHGTRVVAVEQHRPRSEP